MFRNFGNGTGIKTTPMFSICVCVFCLIHGSGFHVVCDVLGWFSGCVGVYYFWIRDCLVTVLWYSWWVEVFVLHFEFRSCLHQITHQICPLLVLDLFGLHVWGSFFMVVSIFVSDLL